MSPGKPEYIQHDVAHPSPSSITSEDRPESSPAVTARLAVATSGGAVAMATALVLAGASPPLPSPPLLLLLVGVAVV